MWCEGCSPLLLAAGAQASRQGATGCRRDRSSLSSIAGWVAQDAFDIGPHHASGHQLGLGLHLQLTAQAFEHIGGRDALALHRDLPVERGMASTVTNGCMAAGAYLAAPARSKTLPASTRPLVYQQVVL